MDPDVLLQMARDAIATYKSTDDEETANNAAEDLVNAFEALDLWLGRGGFKPKDWQGVPLGQMDPAIKTAVVNRALNQLEEEGL